MDIVRFPDGAAFMDRAGSFLESAELENLLLLSVSRGPGAEEGAYLATAEDGGCVVACAVRTPPWKAIVSGGPDEALALLAADLHGEYESLPGVIGPVPEVERFAAEWGERAGVAVRAGVAQGILAASDVRVPESSPDGTIRTATEADLLLVFDWMHAFRLETGIDAPGDDEAAMRRYVQNQALFLWEHGGSVSMAGWGGKTGGGARVGPVYTPPEHRRRGYASSCVALLARRLLEGGLAYVGLFTDLANPTSNHIYESIGYERVCEMRDYHFD